MFRITLQYPDFKLKGFSGKGVTEACPTGSDIAHISLLLSKEFLKMFDHFVTDVFIKLSI